MAAAAGAAALAVGKLPPYSQTLTRPRDLTLQLAGPFLVGSPAVFPVLVGRHYPRRVASLQSRALRKGRGNVNCLA
eukprot:scaffold604_cov384-Prasinococcus_capsulatus_cf.AAC.26